LSHPLQKQGILPLWFADKADYARIDSSDKLETVGLADVFQDANSVIKLRVLKSSGDVFEIKTQHTMSKDQLEWLRAGSALNHICLKATTGKETV
jgi:homoaconitase